MDLNFCKTLNDLMTHLYKQIEKNNFKYRTETVIYLAYFKQSKVLRMIGAINMSQVRLVGPIQPMI